MMLNQEKTAAVLMAMDVPEPKAVRKAADTSRGIFLLIFSLVLLLIAAAIPLVPVFVMHDKPDKWLLLFAAPFAIGGVVILWAGGHLMSAEAMDASESALLKMGKAAADRLRKKAT
jgi:VIT1/CCC1 family predicted Fe2+/Mn2+ transporter